MYGFLYDSVANFILIKKFTLVTTWFYSVRSYKRLISFKKWLLNKWCNSKLKNIKLPKQNFVGIADNFKLFKYIQFGINFFLSKNIGLDYQSGYLKVFYSDNLIWKMNDLMSLLLRSTLILYQLLTLVSIKKIWTRTPCTVLKLRKRFLLKTIKPYVSNSFVKKRFFKNKFLKIFWFNKFLGKRKTGSWRRRMFIFGFFRVLKNRAYRGILKWKKTKFSKKFIKYLFYYRYLKYVNPDYAKKFSLNVIDVYSKFYVKTIGLQFASNIIKDYQSYYSIPIKQFSRNVNIKSLNKLKNLFKDFYNSKFLMGKKKINNSIYLFWNYFKNNKIIKFYKYFIILNIIFYKKILLNIPLTSKMYFFIKDNIKIISFMFIYFKQFSSLKFNLYKLNFISKFKNVDYNQKNVDLTVHKIIDVIYSKISLYKVCSITQNHFIDFKIWLEKKFNCIHLDWLFWNKLKYKFMHLNSFYNLGYCKLKNKYYKFKKSHFLNLYLKKWDFFMNVMWFNKSSSWKQNWFKKKLPDVYNKRLINYKKRILGDHWLHKRNKKWYVKFSSNRFNKCLEKILIDGKKSLYRFSIYNYPSLKKIFKLRFLLRKKRRKRYLNFLLWKFKISLQNARKLFSLWSKNIIYIKFLRNWKKTKGYKIILKLLKIGIDFNSIKKKKNLLIFFLRFWKLRLLENWFKLNKKYKKIFKWLSLTSTFEYKYLKSLKLISILVNFKFNKFIKFFWIRNGGTFVINKRLDINKNVYYWNLNFKSFIYFILKNLYCEKKINLNSEIYFFNYINKFFFNFKIKKKIYNFNNQDLWNLNYSNNLNLVLNKKSVVFMNLFLKNLNNKNFK